MLTIVEALDFSVAARTKRPACFGVATVCETPLKRNVIRQIQQYALDLKVIRMLPDVLELLCICASCAKNSSLERRMPESGTKAITTLLRLRRAIQSNYPCFSEVHSTQNMFCTNNFHAQILVATFSVYRNLGCTSLSFISWGAVSSSRWLSWLAGHSVHASRKPLRIETWCELANYNEQ